MNCDRVFDVLTRGPFPSGDPADAEVQRHLAICPACAEFAEALRPAVALFHEAVAEQQSRELPGYWGGLIDAAPPHAEPQPARGGSLRDPAMAPSVRLAHRNGWWLAAAALIGFALGATLWIARDFERLTGPSAEAAFSAEANRPEATHSLAAAVAASMRRESIERLRPHLALACLQRQTTEAGPAENAAGLPGERLLAQSDEAGLGCCTECHALAGDVHVPRSATHLVGQSCSICHN